jgi:predicted nucleic acid-binding protein
MILVDTSVLVGYFRGIKNPSSEALDKLIDNNIPFGINNYIYQELLQGAKTQKEFEKLNEYLNVLPFYNLLYNRKSYEMAANLYL